MSTATATAYKYSVAGHLSFGAPKCEKAQKSSGFWANRTYWLCIKDNVLIDPCMGSGHILVYAFDVLMQIYESAGYGQRDAARSILVNNLYGLDIDDRAFQMAYFAIMMKARQYNRRILNGEYMPNVFSIQESNGISRDQLKYFGAGLNDFEKNNAFTQMTGLLDTFKDAKEYGSILTVDQYDWGLLERFASNIEVVGQLSMYTVGLDDTAEELKQIIAQGKTLAQKYHVTITNPPYMGGSGMSSKLDAFVKEHYPDSKNDLFAVFIEKCGNLILSNGYQAMITQQAWMFLSGYEKLRNKLLHRDLVTMAHLGPRAFEEIAGEVVQTTCFVFRNNRISHYRGKYSRLLEFSSQATKENGFLQHKNEFSTSQDRFSVISGKPIAYWVSDKILDTFNNKTLDFYASTNNGFTTGDNNRFLRLWFEVDCLKIDYNNPSVETSTRNGATWFPYNKGGESRKWYGNNDYVINWKNNGAALKAYGHLVPRSLKYMFRESVTWNKITTGTATFRYKPVGTMFDVGGLSLFPNNPNDIYYFIALCNSVYTKKVLEIISPTLNCETGHVSAIPVIVDNNKSRISDIAKECVSISKEDWDSFETSWDFAKHPLLIDTSTIRKAFDFWNSTCEERCRKLCKNEEMLNTLFINMYNLNEELSPVVQKESISLHTANVSNDIRSLLSYFVGCAFGRYSLDYDGLVYAGGEWDAKKYSSFMPDEDNVIPITDEEYLEDDIVSRLCTWLKVVYGESCLEDNLDFIAKALGNKGASSREVIRNYFINDFFKDHCQTYSVTGSGKRPIYWLFDSGKQNGFKALIYLHRYNADTVGNLRIDYLHRMQRIYESEISRMQDMIDHSTNTREVAQANKRREKLTKQLKECREYDEKLAHLALSRIELDLDDGVKMNYRKLQTSSDGKYYEVLADSKNIMAKI